MARRVYPLTGYTFNPTTNTITIPQGIRQEKVLLMTNVTTGTVIYNFSDSTINAATWTVASESTNTSRSTTTIVLKYNCAAMSSTDKIQIVLDETAEYIEPKPEGIDGVGKMKVSSPTALIDTDFEYGAQPSKWESLELVMNYPGFFGRQTGGNSFDLLSITGDGASPRSKVTVVTNTPHGLNAGDVASVQETQSNNAEGTFLVYPVDAYTFYYTAKGVVSGNVIDGTLSTIYGGGIFDNAHVMGGNTGNLGSWTAVSDQANASSAAGGSRITVVTPNPHGLLPGTPVLISQTSGATLYGNFFVDTVSNPNQLSFIATGQQILNPISTTSQAFYAKPEGYVEHRPMDGGVILTTGNNVCGAQTSRQTRRYFRYQSGKAISFSTGTKFTPTFDASYIGASGVVVGSQTVTIATLQNHNLQPGAYVKIEGVYCVGSYNPYNGVFQVQTVQDVNTFTITINFQSQINAIDQVPGGVNVSITAFQWKGAATRAGLFSEQDGFYFEYDGQSIHAVRRWSTRELRGTINTTQYSNVVTGTNTLFRKQLVAGDKIVIKGQSYLVIQINSDTSMNIAPAYRAPTNTNTKYRKTQWLKTPQSQWNLDKMDGTGPSGHILDISKMQMTYIDYSWYGAGTIRWGFRGQDGKVTWVHQASQNNVNTAAYQRSGNLPARYETINEPLTNTRLVAGGTAVQGSTLYAADTTMFVEDVSNWPSSGYLRINDGSNFEICSYSSVGAFNSSAQGYPITIQRRVQQTVYYSGAAFLLNGSYTLNNYSPDNTIPGGAGVAQVSVMVISQQCAPVMSHWGSSVIMDGGFDDDKSFIFTANMQRYLQVGGSGSVSATITNRSAVSGTATLTTSATHSLQTGYSATISGVNNVYSLTYKQVNSNVATLTTSQSHNFLVGQSVTVVGVDTTFNGTYTITAVTANTLSYTRAVGNLGLTSISSTNNATATTTSVYNGTFTISAVTSNTITYSLASGNTLTETTQAVYPNGSIVQTFGSTQQARPLISMRVAPSVDNGIGRNFGIRELMNTMAAKLYNCNILSQGQFLIQGILNAQSLNGVTIPTDWQINKVGSGSLSQIIYHDGTGSVGNPVTSPTNTIAGGDVIFAFYTDNAGGTNYSVTRVDLTKVRDLGNSILNGDGSTSNPGFPNGPDIITIVATNIGTTPANISATLSWTEAQA